MIPRVLPEGTLVELETIGDGSCLIHSILNSVYPRYQEAENREKRQIADEFRQEFAELLNSKHPDSTDVTYPLNYWDVLNNGFFLFSFIISLSGGDAFFDKDRTLKGVQKYMDSKEYLLAEDIRAICDLLELNYVLVVDGDDDNFTLYSGKMVWSRPFIIIKHLSYNHYESVGLCWKSGCIQTLFAYDSEIVQLFERAGLQHSIPEPVNDTYNFVMSGQSNMDITQRNISFNLKAITQANVNDRYNQPDYTLDKMIYYYFREKDLGRTSPIDDIDNKEYLLEVGIDELANKLMKLYYNKKRNTFTFPKVMEKHVHGLSVDQTDYLVNILHTMIKLQPQAKILYV